MGRRRAISYKRRVNQGIIALYLLDTQDDIASTGSSFSSPFDETQASQGNLKQTFLKRPLVTIYANLTIPFLAPGHASKKGVYTHFKKRNTPQIEARNQLTPFTILVPTLVTKPLTLSDLTEDRASVDPGSLGASRETHSSSPLFSEARLPCISLRSHSSSHLCVC